MTEQTEQSTEGADKRQRALNLRKAGATYQQIADQVGYTNRGTAHRAVVQALREEHQDTVTLTRQLDGQRMDQILMALWPKAMRGDGWAVDRILRLMELRAAPEPVERLGRVEKATTRDLKALPPELRDSALAAAAVELARNIDNGVTPSSCARELRAVMAQLTDLAAPQTPAEPRGGGIADLSARIAARRNTSAG